MTTRKRVKIGLLEHGSRSENPARRRAYLWTRAQTQINADRKAPKGMCGRVQDRGRYWLVTWKEV